MDGFPDGRTMGDHPDRPPGLLTPDGLPGRLLSQQPQQRVRRRGQRLARPQESTADQQHHSTWMNGAPQTSCYVRTCEDTAPLPPCLSVAAASPEFVQVSGGCSVLAGVNEGEQCVPVSMCEAGRGGGCGGTRQPRAPLSALAGGEASDQLTARSVPSSPRAHDHHVQMRLQSRVTEHTLPEHSTPKSRWGKMQHERLTKKNYSGSYRGDR